MAVRATASWMLAVAGLILGACTAFIDGEGPPALSGEGSAPSAGGGGPAPGAPTDDEPPFEVERAVCGAWAGPSDGGLADLPLRRLAKRQYELVVADLVGRSRLPPAEAAAVLAALSDELAQLPADRMVGVPGEKHGGFARLDQALQQGHVDAAYALANALGRELTATSSRRQVVVGACATDSTTANDAQCLRDFLTRFGLLVHRRPLTPDDVAFYFSVAGSTPVDPAVLSDVIALLLTAPQFVYHFEEGAPDAGGPTELDAYALASRLAFHFWQTMPDEALLGAAADGGLMTEAGWRAQVERLFSDARTERMLNEFFGQWWRLQELPPLDTRVGTPVFDAFAGADVPTASLHHDMVAEVLEMARFVTRGDGGVATLLTDRHLFARSDGLSRLYGQPRWTGAGAPPLLTQPARQGLLTRPAFLASGSAATRPVMKGFFIRNALLCAPIPPPPAGAEGTPLPLSPDLTTRETVERITQAPNSTCRGCHLSLLNPLGFVTENFDALGRARSTQRLFADDGRLVGERPVSTTVQPNVAGSIADIDGTEALNQLMLAGQFQTCFARQYFRFAFGRVEEPDGRDGCVLRALEEAALSGQSVAEVFKAVALRPEFKRRDLR